MEPRIQYAKTSDGVSIAYWTLGEGRVLLVSPPLIFSHLTLELQFPPVRAWYDRLARERTVVRWDPRCNGLSDRAAPGQMYGNVMDIEAIFDRVTREPCDIVAVSHPGNGAIEYAADHPGDVANLVLVEPELRGRRFGDGQQTAISTLAEQDETLWSENYARYVLGWESGRNAKAYAEFIRASVSREEVVSHASELEDFDRTSMLSRLALRTLVISSPLTGRDRQPTRDVAAAIEGAELVEVESSGLRGVFADAESRAIDDFLGLRPHSGDEVTRPSDTAIILFADIVESTSLTEKIGDAAFRDKARTLDEDLRTIIHEAKGTPVEGKLLGDGVLAVFTSAKNAIEAATGFGKAAESVELGLHLGIHAGDVIREGNNVYGGAVNIAARIADASAPGEVLVSDTVRGLARTSAGVSFEDRGEHTLKGIEEPQRLYEVRRNEE